VGGGVKKICLRVVIIRAIAFLVFKMLNFSGFQHFKWISDQPKFKKFDVLSWSAAGWQSGYTASKERAISSTIRYVSAVGRA
jgi:hypothetical protein